jgi:hypothetical protein
MPAPPTPEENYSLLYAIITSAGNVTIDWEEVFKTTGLTKFAA